MQIDDDAWRKFLLLAKAIYNGDPTYNKDDPKRRKRKGNTVIGNKDADIFDVFNFWREEILGGQVYSKQYMATIVERAIADEEEEEMKRAKRK